MEKIQSAIAKARSERKRQPSRRDGLILRPRQMQDEDHQVDAWSDLPLLQPSMRRLRSNRIVTLERCIEAIGFDKLRTRVLQQMQANNWTRMAITSPGASSGKSTVALNLAFSMSRQSRSRVLLSEMDLRKPSLSKMLRLQTDRDFREVLSGNASFADHGLRLQSNLAAGILQGPLGGSAELLQDTSAAVILDSIQAEYAPTTMMFDMPPINVSDDVMAFGDKIDCVLIIAAAEQTKMSELDTCERELANVTNILGIVLNKARYETTDAAYNYYG